MKKRLRRLLLIVGVCLPLLWLVLSLRTTPKPTARQEIFGGIWLSIESIVTASGDSSKVMVVEIHWDTPGISIRNRPFSFTINPEDKTAPHYRLINADWALSETSAKILMNTTRYHPDSPLRSIPGFAVRSVETVVDDRQESHVHEHSYLLYIDDEGTGHQSLTKPPAPEDLSEAVWGIGIQGVQVAYGKPNYHALSDLTDEFSRSFIGMNPQRKILYLLAFDRVDGKTMIDKAVSAGVVFGGQVDSGGSTNLLIGKGAKGLRSHTGIRNWRPLGAYLTIHAEELKQ